MGFFAFLSPLASCSRENKLLRDQLDFFIYECGELKAELKLERKRNRDREDSLTNIILTGANKFGLPLHSEIKAEDVPEIYTTPEITSAEIAVYEDEQIEAVVDQLMSQYNRIGQTVSREEVKDKVLANKEEYLND